MYYTTSTTTAMPYQWSTNTYNVTTREQDETLKLALSECKRLTDALAAVRQENETLKEQNKNLKRIIDENEWRDLMGNVS